MADEDTTDGFGARDWRPLSSSNMEAYQYDSRDRVLRIRFNGGREYAYQDVPPDVAEGLGSAPSPGKFFHALIKDSYSMGWGRR